MSTQLHLARGLVEGRASTWQDITSFRTSVGAPKTVRPARRIRTRR